ncbi:hypothetical protein O6H91_01G121400 [Diphasiastrum complanatum]|uniref:Uncharacterized protein n=1 Tax=Diphasiastrum complanatum TaxID=34168 RepID=A0ACC2EVK9_DIPCM|nr:hypothetical protein O6H91_01G121400 [Diphasiastrum complanatum]
MSYFPTCSHICSYFAYYHCMTKIFSVFIYCEDEIDGQGQVLGPATLRWASCSSNHFGARAPASLFVAEVEVEPLSMRTVSICGSMAAGGRDYMGSWRIACN